MENVLGVCHYTNKATLSIFLHFDSEVSKKMTLALQKWQQLLELLLPGHSTLIRHERERERDYLFW